LIGPYADARLLDEFAAHLGHAVIKPQKFLGMDDYGINRSSLTVAFSERATRLIRTLFISDVHLGARSCQAGFLIFFAVTTPARFIWLAILSKAGN
jgi:hypothetical protein